MRLTTGPHSVPPIWRAQPSTAAWRPIDRSRSGTAQATFSDSEREIVRKHAHSSRPQPRSSRTEQRTTSSVTSTRVRVGDRLPDSLEIRSFPDEVYRESVRLREYRYIERGDRTYIIEPGERRIIEEIDD